MDELRQAVLNADTERVEALLAGGANPNVDHEGVSLFEWALRNERRRREILVALFDAGADVGRVSRQSLNLVWAADTGRLEIVRAFLAAGAAVDVEALMGTPLSVAASRGHAEITSELIDAGADLDLTRVFQTPLMAAVWSGQEETACLLVEAGASWERLSVARVAHKGMARLLRALAAAGADLGRRGTIYDVDREPIGERIGAALDGAAETGFGSAGLLDDETVSARYEDASPLIVAAGEGRLDCVDVLLAADVDVGIRDAGGRTALDHARAAGHEEIAAHLAEAGGGSVAAPPPDETLLLAAERGDLAGARAALGAGARVDARDERSAQQGRSPLMLASHSGHEALVELLLEAGADVNHSDFAPEEPFRTDYAYLMRRDCRGRSALMLAAAAGHADIAARLLAAGADAGRRDTEGDTALTLAARRDRAALVRTLVAAGAPLDQRDDDGDSPLHVAIADDCVAAAIALIDAGAAVDEKNEEGDTPLHTAALMGNRDLVQRLVDAGADPTALNAEGETPRESDFEARLSSLFDAAEAAWEARAQVEEAARVGDAVPSLSVLRKRYAADAVRERLGAACAGEAFQALLPEIAAACGGEPCDERARLGGFSFPVARGALDLEALERLHAAMLARGAFVFACAAASPGVPGRLFALPTSEAADAIAVWETAGANNDPTTAQIIRWTLETPAARIVWIEPDALRGRFRDPVSDGPDLARRMLGICPELVDSEAAERGEILDALAQTLTETRGFSLAWG
ncbi:MAG: ankyrin repeat domain-containing protein [Myxococcota bacterium]|nr:ankyrin repeat domain-containing protein [Myxococcota bacterium]